MSLLETSARLAFDSTDRPDAPLGTLLFRAGLVPEDKLRQALDDSISEGRRLGEVLLERGLIEERALARILASQKGLPFLDLAEHGLDREAVRLLPQEKARLWGALAIGFEESRPLVAVSDPANRRVFGEITATLGCKPRFAVAVPTVLETLIPAAYTGMTREEGPSASPPVAVDPDTPAEKHDPDRLVHVSVLLSNGDRINLAPPAELPAALVVAKRLIETLDEHAPGEWPFLAGRFLRPDAIVSVDIIESADGRDAPAS